MLLVAVKLWRLCTSAQASLFNDDDVCSHQFRPRSSTTTTFEYFSSSLVLQCHHYGVCWQHFRPRSSRKRKVYDSVYLIFSRRREVFLIVSILKQHVSCFLHARWVIKWIFLPFYPHSLVPLKMANFVCNFWGGEVWISLHVVWCFLKNGHTTLKEKCRLRL